MINRVVLLGRITKNIEMKTAPSGTQIVAFTLAVDGTRKDGEGNRITNWIPCIAFGRNAETLNRYCAKGSQVAVEGALQTRRYERRDGTTATVVEVIVQTVTLCGSKPTNQPRNEDPFGISQGNNVGFDDFNQSNNSEEVDYSQMDLADDDLPF